MPKIKQVLKDVENAAGQIVDDKEDRVENCFNILTGEKGLQLCFRDSGDKITSYAQIQGNSIERIDLINEKAAEFCLEQFKKIGIVECKDVPSTLDNIKETVSDVVHGTHGDL